MVNSTNYIVTYQIESLIIQVNGKVDRYGMLKISTQRPDGGQSLEKQCLDDLQRHWESLEISVPLSSLNLKMISHEICDAETHMAWKTIWYRARPWWKFWEKYSPKEAISLPDSQQVDLV